MTLRSKSSQSAFRWDDSPKTIWREVSNWMAGQIYSSVCEPNRTGVILAHPGPFFTTVAPLPEDSILNATMWPILPSAFKSKYIYNKQSRLNVVYYMQKRRIYVVFHLIFLIYVLFCLIWNGKIWTGIFGLWLLPFYCVINFLDTCFWNFFQESEGLGFRLSPAPQICWGFLPCNPDRCSVGRVDLARVACWHSCVKVAEPISSKTNWIPDRTIFNPIWKLGFFWLRLEKTYWKINIANSNSSETNFTNSET